MPAADPIRFLAAAVKSPGRVGAVAPSSRHLAAAMLRGIELDHGSTVIEFGPGTGPFTRAVRIAMPTRSRYLGIERDEKFVKLLRDRHPDMPVVHGSAEDAARHVADAQLDPATIKLILCGLPFASLPATVQRNVVNALDQLLPPGSHFRTFQYIHAYPLPTAARYRRMMAERFGPVTRSPVVLRNLPPAFVLSWSR